MTYDDALDALLTQLRDRLDLAPTSVLDYEPRAAQHTPLLYALLDQVERTIRGQVVTCHYDVLARLLVVRQDEERSERIMRPYVNTLPAAVDYDATLGGAVQFASIARIAAVYVELGGVVYRALDATIRMKINHPYRQEEL